jgi:hypothetical protein
VKFEIWRRHGEAQHHRAKDPRQEAPDYTIRFSPYDTMWASSMLPEVNLVDHGLTEAEARNAPFQVKSKDGELVFSNRADHEGIIQGMPCPSARSGDPILIELREGRRIDTKAL